MKTFTDLKKLLISGQIFLQCFEGYLRIFLGISKVSLFIARSLAEHWLKNTADDCCMCVCTYVYMCVCMYVRMYVCILYMYVIYVCYIRMCVGLRMCVSTALSTKIPL
jgi:hypothetical protein